MVSLQFITHQTERYSYLESARMALGGGCKWIQLRMKDAPLDEVEAVALQLKPLCKEHEAILILDDHVELAKKLEVDGVHLGKKAISILGGKLTSVDKFQLPDSDLRRALVCIKKVKDTPKKYPRKAGTPAKLPLK